MKHLSLTAILLFGLARAHAADIPADVANAFKDLQILGEVTAQGSALVVGARPATFVVGAADTTTYRLTAQLVLAPKGPPAVVQLMPADAADLLKQPALARLTIGRDGAGRVLSVTSFRFDTGRWVTNKDALPYTFWPAETDKAGLRAVADSGLEPQTWHDRRLRLRIDADPHGVNVWLEGLLVRRFDRPAGARGPVALQLGPGDRLDAAGSRPLPASPLYLPLDLGGLANDHFTPPLGKTTLTDAGVPFELPPGPHDHVSPRRAGWTEVQRDPASYYERYDAGPMVLHDPRMPLLRVPVADYTAAHVLAVADDDTALTNALTVQAGRYGFAGQVVQYDFVGRVPRRGQTTDLDTARPVAALDGRLFHVRIPMTTAFAQDLERFLEITLTKEIRLARRRPDPARFRYRPLGLPSGVRVAAVTLERSPLQLRVTSRETGHAFVEPQKPEFQIRLENITTVAQPYTLRLAATHLDGTPAQAQQTGRVAPAQAAEVTLTVPVTKRGYHDLVVTLLDGRRQTLLQRPTSFALLPPDTRRHRDQSPFGTWDFCGGHYTSADPDQVGPLYVKLGLRYGMFSFPPAARKKYGVLPGSEFQAVPGGAAGFAKHLEKSPDSLPVALLFHEHSVSGRHVTRVPDLFHDRPQYRMEPAEAERFRKMMADATQAARSMRAQYPQVDLRLGNGPLPLKEEMLRHKFPADLFDSAGNESASFGRPPEAQPPDYVANNASLWMDRQLLDAYGYRDKPVTQCYEICYPNTNPGNLDPRTQADYFVRHALHALAWGIKEFRPGCISDVGNSYYFSNWGASGFCRRKPELNVKPAFVAFATLTRVLDGAKFVRPLDLGSASLYGLEFDLPDGARAYALWTLRGRRPLRLTADGTGWKRIDDQANEAELTAAKGVIEVTLTPSPLYVLGKGRVTAAAAGAPTYADKPEGRATVLSPLADLSGWAVAKERSPELEFYNFMTPRRPGDFGFEPVAGFEGRQNVLRIAPRPPTLPSPRGGEGRVGGKDTMPMYAVLAHGRGIPVPGTPTEIGAWVNGNSGWGRILFELTDASGQRWVSLGAQQGGETNRWLEDMVPKEMLAKFPTPGLSDWNTEDVFGLSRVNFDGWRWVGFPLPGNYPGEHYPWPATSQWRWDKDGVVHYPLTFRKLIVELPEKVLHLRDWGPVRRPEIYLRDLTVGQGDTVRLKNTAGE